MKGKKYLSAFVSLVLLFALGACKGSNSTGNNHASATIKAGLNVGINSSANHASPKFATAVIGTMSDVASITVDVYDGSSLIVNGTQLTNNSGTWSATIGDLPVGEQLTFTGHAYNSSDVEIFTGTTTQTLTGVDDEVIIAMAPVSNNTTMQFLQITKITRPAEVVTGGNAPVSISVAGNTGETLSYEITPAENGGWFNPSSGTITLSGTFATIVVNYTAPDTTGSYTHSVTVTNGQGNSVQTTFDTNVASQLAAAKVFVLQFNPVITALVPARSGSYVTFTAYVSDAGDPAALTYNWSFSPAWNSSSGYSLYNSTSNSTTMYGYDEDVAGDLIVTVTNGSGASTTVTYRINKGQFPESVVSNMPLLPQNAVATDIDDCRFGAVSGNYVTLVVPENDVDQDLNNDGDMSDSVLHYIDVTQGARVNTGIAVRQDSIAINGDIMAFQYPNTLTIGWYSISTQEVHDTGITPAAFGREYFGSTRVVSNGRIVYIAATRDLNGDEMPDVELNIYDTTSQQSTPTGVLVGPGQQPYWNWRDFVPSFSGDLVAFVGPAGTIAYYNVVTQQTIDTGVTGEHPTIDNGIIVFNAPSGKVWYYDISRAEAVATAIPVNHNYDASISNGIIAAAINEDSYWGDLNGDGVIGNDDSGIIVLLDIPTGRMVSTGVMLCCGPEISGFVIAFDWDVCDQWYLVLDDWVKQYFGR